MKRTQLQSHTTEPDSVDIQSFTELEEFERNSTSNGHQNGNTNGHRNPSATVETAPEKTVDHQSDDQSDGQTDQAATDDLEEPKASNSGRRKVMFLVGAIALAAASVFGFRWWQFGQTHVTTDNAQIQGHLSPIAPRISATVQEVLVEEGDYVKAGQPLVRLEDQDLNLKVKQAEAELASARAKLQETTNAVRVTSQTNPTQVQQSQAQLSASLSSVSAAQAGVNQAQAAIETNQAKVAQAQAEVERTQADFRRYESLYREGATSAQQFEVARTAYLNAQADLVAANRTVAQSRAELSNAQAQVQRAVAEANAARGQVQETQASGQNITVQQAQQQQAQAQIEQATAALELARQQLQYTVITAPVSGYVGQLTAQVGQKVQTGQALLSVVPLQSEEVYVEANFKETQLGRLQIGDEAEIEVDAYPDETFPARIAGISPATGSSYALLPPDNATGNFNKVVQWVPVRLVFDENTDPEHKLRPGLNVNVIVDTTTAPQTSQNTP